MIDKKDFKIKRRTTRSRTICIDTKHINIDANRHVSANEDYLVEVSENVDLSKSEVIIELNKKGKQEQKEQNNNGKIENNKKQKRVSFDIPLVSIIHKYQQICYDDNQGKIIKKVTFNDPVISNVHKYQQISYDDNNKEIFKDIKAVSFTDPVISNIHVYDQVFYKENKILLNKKDKKVSFADPLVNSVHKYEQVVYEAEELYKNKYKVPKFVDDLKPKIDIENVSDTKLTLVHQNIKPDIEKILFLNYNIVDEKIHKTEELMFLKKNKKKQKRARKLYSTLVNYDTLSKNRHYNNYDKKSIHKMIYNNQLDKTGNLEKITINEKELKNNKKRIEIDKDKNIEKRIEMEKDVNIKKYTEENQNIKKYTEENQNIKKYTEENQNIKKYTEENQNIKKYTEENQNIEKRIEMGKYVSIKKYSEENQNINTINIPTKFTENISSCKINIKDRISYFENILSRNINQKDKSITNKKDIKNNRNDKIDQSNNLSNLKINKQDINSLNSNRANSYYKNNINIHKINRTFNFMKLKDYWNK